MEETMVLCGANSYVEKYYFNEKFKGLPEAVKEELQIMCVMFTEDVGGVLTLEFTPEGELQFKVASADTDYLFDEIGSALKIKQYQREKRELLESLELYYRVFIREDGEKGRASGREDAGERERAGQMKLKIGNVELDSPVALAPMAGVTDLPFRILCREQGCGLMCTEMVSAKALLYKNRNTKPLLETKPEERPVAVQLFGSDPEIMSEMALMLEEGPYDIIDEKGLTMRASMPWSLQRWRSRAERRLWQSMGEPGNSFIPERLTGTLSGR